MWSTAGQVPAVRQVDINHFVPLVKMQSVGCGVAPAVMQVDDTDEHAAATVDDSVKMHQPETDFTTSSSATADDAAAEEASTAG